jgi:hypothetical protein
VRVANSYDCTKSSSKIGAIVTILFDKGGQ